MKDKRQGNDLKVAWSIFMQDGEPFRLDGKDVSLYLKNMFGRKELNDFVTTGNVIQWTFYGKDQKNTGKYSLELVINEGEKGMITTDKCDFVNLVSCSCKLQGGEDAPNVETESIELTSTLEYVAGGMSEEEVLNLLDGKVDKVEGLGLSEESYTADEKKKLAGLENYDDSGIKEELAKKAEKSEIPTKMSQLEQDIEIGGEVDLSDYPTREEVSETYLPRDEFDERIEGYATHDRVQELSENVTELSAEVSGLSERVDALAEGGSEIFVAVYGVTTYEEISAAMQTYKEAVCEYQKLHYRLVSLDGGAIFTTDMGNYHYRIVCSLQNRWSNAYFNRMHSLENLANGNVKVTIEGKTAEVATPQYVENAIQQSGGGGASSDKQGVVSQTLNYNSADNTYSVSNVVRGSIPSFFIDLVTEAGASFNAESGYFSLNGIDNIAYDEMRQIYNCRTGYGVNSLLAVYDKTYTARTNFAAFRGASASFANHEPTTIYTKYLGYQNASITKFALSDSAIEVKSGSANNFDSFGSGAGVWDKSRLEEIIGIIRVSNLTGANNFFYNGAWHPWLTTLYLNSLKASIDLSGMPRLSEATILYMINNEKAASAITIKLHADAKAMADASEAIQSALAAHTNITLGV